MKFLTSILVFLLFAQQLYAQDTTDETWDLLLGDVKTRYSYSIKFDTFFPKPKFGKDLKEMDGQTITLRGYFLPTNLTGMAFILSYAPSSMCYFCAGAGIESVVEINPTEDDLFRFERLRIDDYFEVTGTLKLNFKDIEHLYYIIDDAEFVKIVR